MPRCRPALPSGDVTDRIRCFAVPGNGGSAARWQRLTAHLPDDIDLRPVTLPGFGGRPMDVDHPTVDDFAAWLRRDIGAELADDPGPSVVLGHGIGGSVLLQAAQVGAVADGYIFHAPVGPFLGDRLFPRLMRPPLVRHTARRAISGPLGRMLLRRRFDADMAAAFARGYADCDAFSVMFDILDQDWFDDLRPITTPSTLLWGGGDRVLKEEYVHGFSGVLPDASIEIEPDWAHYPMIDNAADYARVLAEQCRLLTGTAGGGS